jgi:hypothetical protein
VVDGKICCGGCGEWKAWTTDNFYQRTNGKMEAKCIPCQVEYTRQYRETHELTDEQYVAKRAIAKQWAIDNKEKVNEQERQKTAAKKIARDAAKYKDIGGKICVCCTKCNEWKEQNDTNFYAPPNGKFISYCRKCQSEHRKVNKPILTDKQKSRHLETQKHWRDDNKEQANATIRQWKIDNREHINAREKQRMEEDISFRLRKLVSGRVAKMLKNADTSKNGSSILQHLQYTMQELKSHLEKQFEDWMTWENHGVYKLNEWKENDQSTWKWQIDHIIPQSDLPYHSMENENFSRCWALANLRPLSAKQNMIDGATRARHNKALPIDGLTKGTDDMTNLITTKDQ